MLPKKVAAKIARRDKKRAKKMPVSGHSVLAIKRLIDQRRQRD